MSGCHSRDHGSTLPDGFGGWGSWVGMAEPSPANHQAVFATRVPTQMPLPEIHLDFPNANGFEKGALLAPLQEAANGGGQVSRRSLARTPAYERSEGRCRGEPQKKPGGGEMPKGKYPRSRRGGSKLGGLNGGGFLRGSSCHCLRTRFQSQWEFGERGAGAASEPGNGRGTQGRAGRPGDGSGTGIQAKIHNQWRLGPAPLLPNTLNGAKRTTGFPGAHTPQPQPFFGCGRAPLPPPLPLGTHAGAML